MKKLLATLMALGLALILCSCSLAGTLGGRLQQILDKQTAQPQQTQEATGVPETTEAPATSETPEAPDGGDVSGAENLSGNLAAGGYLAMDAQGALYAARGGIYKQDAQGLRRICEDSADHLNVCGDRLIYVSADWEGDEGVSRIVSVDLEGGDRKVLAGEARCAYEIDFNDDWTETTVNYLCGYADATVWEGYVYFIADNDDGTTQRMYNPYSSGNVTVTWNHDKSICRVPVDGGEVEELVKGLGNGRPSLAIAQGRIWYSTSYESGAFSYPVTTFHSCALDGSDDQLLYGNGELNAPDATREIVMGLFASDGVLYVSASDSEGDFPNSRLMCVQNGTYEMMGEETYYVPTTVDGQGRLYWFVHEGDVLWDEDDGVVVDEYLNNVRLIRTQPGGDTARCDELLRFDRLERFGDDFSTFTVYVLDGKVYALTQDDVYLVENGAATEVMDLPDLNDND